LRRVFVIDEILYN